MRANLALGVDEVMSRPVLILESRPDGAPAVHGNRIRDAEIPHRFRDVASVALECKLRRVDADDHEAVVLVPLGPRLDVRNRPKAIDAGVGPEVDEHDMTAK